MRSTLLPTPSRDATRARHGAEPALSGLDVASRGQEVRTAVLADTGNCSHPLSTTDDGVRIVQPVAGDVHRTGSARPRAEAAPTYLDLTRPGDEVRPALFAGAFLGSVAAALVDDESLTGLDANRRDPIPLSDIAPETGRDEVLGPVVGTVPVEMLNGQLIHCVAFVPSLGQVPLDGFPAVVTWMGSSTDLVPEHRTVLPHLAAVVDCERMVGDVQDAVSSHPRTLAVHGG